MKSCGETNPNFRVLRPHTSVWAAPASNQCDSDESQCENVLNVVWDVKLKGGKRKSLVGGEGANLGRKETQQP
jgi:hypothetical protein